MKRLKTILLFLVICISCFAQNRTRTNTTTNANTSNNTTNATSQRIIWEYEVITVTDDHILFSDTSRAPEFSDQTDVLNLMGRNGWELVSVYTEVTTYFPNFGDSRYFTGIRGNTRTSEIKFVFKRPKSGK